MIVNLIDEFVEKATVIQGTICKTNEVQVHSILLTMFCELLGKLEEIRGREKILVLDDIYHKLPNADLFYILRYKYYNSARIVTKNSVEAVEEVIRLHEGRDNRGCRREKQETSDIKEDVLQAINCGEGLQMEFVIDGLFKRFFIDEMVEEFIDNHKSMARAHVWRSENDRIFLDTDKMVEISNFIELLLMILDSDFETEDMIDIVHEIYHKVSEKLILETICLLDNFVDDEGKIEAIKGLLELNIKVHDRKLAIPICCYKKIGRG